jgi:hypothetical protein
VARLIESGRAVACDAALGVLRAVPAADLAQPDTQLLAEFLRDKVAPLVRVRCGC